ncbi:MAG: hypothetical protein U5O39_15300 [Gammaproteobacteria bacterium]|nr:hypothetical protein [Gammaproteobacteria bacterium]
MAATDDREFLDLTEIEPDSGVFVGYVQSVEESSEVGSCTLSVEKDELIMTRYTDAFDQTDTAETRLLVDPFGIVFDTRSGDLIDGVTVTLIDETTGEPAEVFGDGPQFAEYPNPVTTGSTATDDAGIVYEFPEGGYRFPFVEPGDCRLRLSGLPDGLVFPSVVDDESIQQLPDSPYALEDGSRGEKFEVPVGPALNIDLPVDRPAAQMFVTKTASKQVVGIGDFVQYRVSLTNEISGPSGDSTLIDTLPKGFRYQAGSLRVDGDTAVDPRIGPAGRQLSINLPNVVGDAVEVSYVTEITPGASIGEAINSATVSGKLVASSNTASARVTVKEDLFNRKAILTGRVTLEQCGEEAEEAPEGVRTFGSISRMAASVSTDSDGLRHIEGVEPGRMSFSSMRILWTSAMRRVPAMTTRDSRARRTRSSSMFREAPSGVPISRFSRSRHPRRKSG